MAYTAGATHALSGYGSVAVSSPQALRVVLSALPAGIGAKWSNPRTLIQAGHVTPTTAFGALPSVELVHDDQLVAGLPSGVTSLGYDLVPGSSCVVTELLLAAAPAVRDQPWDRNPTHVNQQLGTDPSGAVAQTTAISYTVPAGRKLMLYQAEVSLTCEQNVAAGARTIIWMRINGVAVFSVYMWSAVVGQRARDDMGAGPMFLNPGATIDVQYQHNAAGGIMLYQASYSGILFDA